MRRLFDLELAEPLLLLREQEPLVELVPGEVPLVGLAEPGAGRARAEERELAGGLRLAFGEDRRRDLLPRRLLADLLHHPPPRVPERVERAGEDERLEDTFRQCPGVDAPAQVGEGLEGSARSASVQDGLHDTFPDVADRGQAVADRSAIT